MHTERPNHPSPGKAGRAPRLATGHHRPGLPDTGRLGVMAGIHRVSSSGHYAPLMRTSILILVVLAGVLGCSRQTQHTAPATETTSLTLEVTNTQEDELLAVPSPTRVDVYEKVLRHMMGTNVATSFINTDDPEATAALITLLNTEAQPVKSIDGVDRRPGFGGVFEPSTGARARILHVRTYTWELDDSAMEVEASYRVLPIGAETYRYSLKNDHGRVTIISRKLIRHAPY
jgi:hypothetical protein